MSMMLRMRWGRNALDSCRRSLSASGCPGRRHQLMKGSHCSGAACEPFTEVECKVGVADVVQSLRGKNIKWKETRQAKNLASVINDRVKLTGSRTTAAG